uniref:Nop domain-containing protein n=1 Tax=Steinernema glaseri TaxID=37863 RepID=A0A1I8ASI4_9BILA
MFTPPSQFSAKEPTKKCDRPNDLRLVAGSRVENSDFVASLPLAAVAMEFRSFRGRARYFVAVSGIMLVLFETAAGYAVFKLLDDAKLKKADNIWEEFNTPEKAQECLQLVNFKKFKSTSEALESAVDLNDGKLSKTLKKLLKKSAGDEELAVGDAKLGKLINEKLEVPCVHNSAIAELMRSIRSNIGSLLAEHKEEMNAMNLALAHSMGRYKVKFNPEKIDTMIVQAVSLLDDLDKELNNYQMRAREWYGWHFPELGKIITDHVAYAKVIKTIGMRQNAVDTDLSAVLPEDLEAKVKSDAEISMGTDISELDLLHIQQLCDQVIELTDYRAQLSEYLKNRMVALAPNLTVLLGELVGARLISHAGSLVSLAKYPASTVQILGAEKALFRALKTKRDTPKYGLIYHAQLIGQAATAYKGKMARKLAAKVSLATRIDALGEDSNAGAEVGIEARAYLENQMRSEQERIAHKGAPGSHKQKGSYQFKSEVHSYDASADTTAKKSKKRKFDDDEEEKPKKKTKVEEVEEEDSDE